MCCVVTVITLYRIMNRTNRSAALPYPCGALVIIYFRYSRSLQIQTGPRFRQGQASECLLLERPDHLIGPSPVASAVDGVSNVVRWRLPYNRREYEGLSSNKQQQQAYKTTLYRMMNRTNRSAALPYPCGALVIIYFRYSRSLQIQTGPRFRQGPASECLLLERPDHLIGPSPVASAVDGVSNVVRWRLPYNRREYEGLSSNKQQQQAYKTTISAIGACLYPV